MTDQPPQKGATRVCIIVAALTQRLIGALQRLQKCVGGLRGTGHNLMNMMMTTFQYREAERQPLVCSLEDREIMEIFNLMVDVQLVQHELQTRHELACKFGRRKLPAAKLHRDLFNRRRELAEHRVA